MKKSVPIFGDDSSSEEINKLDDSDGDEFGFNIIKKEPK